MTKKTKIHGFSRMVAAWHNSKQGLRDVWLREEAFRLETYVFVLCVPVAIWFGETFLQTVALIGSVLILMIVEILNSAIEAVVDRIGTEPHEYSRIAKDLGSAAVLVTAFIPVCVWIGFFLGHLS